MKKVYAPLLVILALVLAACAPQATPTSAPAPTEAPTPLPTEAPAMEPTEAPTPEPEIPDTSQSNIVELAVADGRFTTLVQALQATGLDQALQAEGPFTVFAPTDEAFAALPAGTLEGLTSEQLSNILLYHVVEGRVLAADVVGLDGQEVPTLLGQPVTVTVEGDIVRINGAQVIITDIETANGVIHVIDQVLLPPQ